MVATHRTRILLSGGALTLLGRASFALGDVLSVMLMAAGLAPMMVGALECLMAGSVSAVVTALRNRSGWAGIWRRQRPLAVFTATSVGLNVSFYLAIVPPTTLGTVTGLMLGVPTVLSAVGVVRKLRGRSRLVAVIWPFAALTGTVALTRVWAGAELSGICWSLAAGLFWYWNTRVSKQMAALDEATAHRITGRGIALSGAVQVLLVLLMGASLHPALHVKVIGTVMLIGLLGTMVPNAVQVRVLGAKYRLGEANYAVLLNMGPVVSAVFGLLLLHQELTLGQWAGLVAVSLAAAGQMFTQGHDHVAEADGHVRELEERLAASVRRLADTQRLLRTVADQVSRDAQALIAAEQVSDQVWRASHTAAMEKSWEIVEALPARRPARANGRRLFVRR